MGTTAEAILLTAPPPNAVSNCTVQVAGLTSGVSTYYYWIVAKYPIGRVISQPFQVRGAPQTRNVQNYVIIAWEGVAAQAYDVLRTADNRLPDGISNIALAVDLAVTRFLDQGQPLQAYDLPGLIHGAPVEGWAYMNNRDYAEPVLELYPAVKVEKIIFNDGSEQDTAGGGVVPATTTTLGGVIIGANVAVQPNGTISVPVTAGFQTPWLSNIDGAQFVLNNVRQIDVTGNVGIGTPNPTYRLDIRTQGNAATQVHISNSDTTAGGHIGSTVPSQLYLAAGTLFDGTNWIASGTQATIINLADGTIDFLGDSGLVPSSSYVPTTRMRITATGRVGIGTAAPVGLLDVVTITPSMDASVNVGQEAPTGMNRAVFNMVANGQIWGLINNGSWDAPNNRFSINTAAGEWMTILPNGNLGIGIEDPVAALELMVTRAIGSRLRFWTGLIPQSVQITATNGAQNIPVEFAGSTFTFIQDGTATGFLGIGLALGVIPNHLLELGANDAAKPGSEFWTVISDIRLKKNVQPYTEGLPLLKQLTPLQAQYNGEDGTPNNTEVVGYSAQAVLPVQPSWVTVVPGKINGVDTEILNLNTGPLVYVLQNAILELDRRLTAIEGVTK